MAAPPPAVAPEEIVGRWGYAAYHKDSDRPRIEAAAKAMYWADAAKPSELRLKGKRCYGPTLPLRWG
jgi:hypothetical protein